MSSPGLRIALTGPSAQAFLATHRAAVVSAVFARSFHIEAGADALCVVDPALGAGALNAVLAERFADANAIFAGAPCAIDAARITIAGTVSIRFDDAQTWTPPPVVRATGWPAARDALLRAALARAPQDGAFRAALDPAFAAGDAVTRALALRSRALGDWIARTRHQAGHDDAGPAPVEGLVGLGSGLTPAGDDLVGGALIALRALADDIVADRLAAAVAALAPGATTLLSRAMLRVACGGTGGEALHDLLAALGRADAAGAIGLLAAIARVGHSSGWDALAGALLALGSSTSS